MIERIFPIALVTMTFMTPLALAEEQRREVSVSGDGEVTVVPDEAALTMGVETRTRELQTARDQVSRTVSEFLELARKMGISKESLNTSQLTIRPEYDWNNATRKRRLIGYYVARQIHVELKDLEKLGPLMERATDLGVNQVTGPYFRSSREDELQRVALKRAAEDARRNAEVLAMTLGATLGPVRTIQAGAISPPRPPVPMARAMMMEAADAEQSYEVGEIKLRAQVNAVFDLVVNP